MAEPESLNWSAVADDEVKEIVRQAEVMLGDMLTSSCAADARAATMAAIYAAVAAAMVAGAMVEATAARSDIGLVASLAAMAVGFVVAALVSVSATQPRDFYASGNEPSRLVPAAVERRHLMISSAKSFQRRIDHNRDVLNKQAKWTYAAHRIALATVIVATLVFVGTR